MNKPVPLSGDAPALRLARRPVAATEPPSEFSAEMSGQLAADLEALREREMNLRDYENRLRVWQAQLDSAVNRSVAPGSSPPFSRPASGAPFGGEPTLEAAWEKFHRARALLEAEQNQMRDDRIVLRDLEQTIKRREAELAEREARVLAREQVLQTAAFEAERKAAPSAVQRFTQAPFLAAKAVFGSGK